MILTSMKPKNNMAILSKPLSRSQRDIQLTTRFQTSESIRKSLPPNSTLLRLKRKLELSSLPTRRPRETQLTTLSQISVWTLKSSKLKLPSFPLSRNSETGTQSKIRMAHMLFQSHTNISKLRAWTIQSALQLAALNSSTQRRRLTQ